MSVTAPRPSNVKLIENAIETNITVSVWIEDMHYYTLTFPGATSGIPFCRRVKPYQSVLLPIHYPLRTEWQYRLGGN